MAGIVCKFGGSSVATTQMVQQIITILNENPKRRLVVVSAPGKAAGIVTKVTDYLLSIAEKSLTQKDIAKDLAGVKQRYYDIYLPLGLTEEQINAVLRRLDDRIEHSQEHKERYRDAIVASGEDMNAVLFAQALSLNGIDAESISPEEAGLIVTPTFGDAQLTEEGAKNIRMLKEHVAQKVVVFPGFFGMTPENEIATFSRGGSDLTGAILADAIDADEYENFTDVNGILSAHPQIIAEPEQIPALTYRELRELSYMGFGVFHEEAVKPVTDKKIPIRLRNTNNLANNGTLIVSERLPDERDIVGIASASNFCSFNISKFLMNKEHGFGRKLLSILEELDLSFEHCPSGVDNLSVILEQDQLHPETVNTVIRRIEQELNPDEVKTEFGLSLVSVVGEGLLHKVGVLASATKALADENINVKIVNQGSSEISMIFGLDSADEERAVKALYNAFFN